MNTRLLYSSILVLLLVASLGQNHTLAQKRTENSRDAGRPAEVAQQKPFSPVPGGADRTVSPKPAESPATPAPVPPQRHPARTEPVQQAPSIADPEPPPARSPVHGSRGGDRSPLRHPHVGDRPPAANIVEGDYVYTGIGMPVGRWIRDGIRFGKDVTLSSLSDVPEYSGYDFSEILKRPFDHPYTDMCVEEDDGDLMMSVWEDSEIMDCGAVLVPPDVIYIPRQDWSPDRRVLLIPGHEYLVQTWDHHYGKFFVTSLLRDRVSFDWAYQVTGDEGPVAVTRGPVTGVQR